MAEGDNGKKDIELQEKDTDRDSARVQHQKDRDRPLQDNSEVGRLQQNKNIDQTKPSGVQKKPTKDPDPPQRDYAAEYNKNIISNQSEASGVSKKPATSFDNKKPPDPPTRDYATEKSEVAGSSGVYASVNKRKTLGSFVRRPEFVYRPDNTEAWMSCLRIGLIIFNLLIWALGAALTGLGVWIRVDKDFWNIQTNLDMTQFEKASYVLIAAGVVIMIVGFIGCYGAIMSQICLLVLFSIIVAIIIVLEIAVIAIVFTVTASKENQEKVKLKAITALHEMMDNEKKRYFIDLVQSKLECCGVNGPQDYSDGVKPIAIPGSCRDENSKVREKGCYDALIEYFKGKAALCGGIAVLVFLLQIGALVFTGCLICSLKQSSNGIF
ncbi:hypothetical protein JTE90_007184 [Oedothorax gibbosus]|uniref:Tetraspanin n=1 Tax=Oedothorax gibbosus TaxID=931172 RepID=A0AAV6UXP8_9ARAC|nr:hypothetical protein JTE90_007184 [Oedothorax gibbosus]